MSDQAKHLKRYQKELEGHLVLDDLGQIVLKGHLLIEKALNNVITAIFAHPEYVEGGNFGFAQKVRIVRAYAPGTDSADMWGRISTINGLRNEIAHNLDHSGRKRRIEELHRYMVGDITPELLKTPEGLNTPAGALIVCLECLGFLSSLEAKVRKLHPSKSG